MKEGFTQSQYPWLRLKTYEIWREFWEKKGIRTPAIVWIDATLEGGAAFNTPLHLTTSHEFFSFTQQFSDHLYFQAQGSEVVNELDFIGLWSQISVDVVRSSPLHLDAKPSMDLWRLIDFRMHAQDAIDV